MVRFFVFAILGSFLSGFLGGISPTLGATATGELPKKAPSIAKRKDVKEAIPPKKPKKNEKENAGRLSPPEDTSDTKKMKTIVVDARRLKDHKLSETIRYIKEHPEVRFKLQNTTIDPTFVLPLLTALSEAQVLDKIKDITFVMLPTANGQTLDEAVFIGKILRYLEHLEGLELLCLGATDKVVKAISTKIPQLKSLSLFGPGITDETVVNLTKELPNLTKIHLINAHLTTKGVQTLADPKNFSQLKALGISGPNLKDSDFVALGTGNPNLHSLSIVGHTFKNMATVVNLLKTMPKLHTLDVSETNVTDDVAKGIVENSKYLKNLNISETTITKDGIKEIIKNLDLTTFKINNLKGLGNTELELIATSQPALRKFHFSGISFSDAGLIDVILGLKKLNDITLIPISGSKWILSEAVARVLVSKKHKIQYLHIQADRLPEDLRMKIENGIPNIRIEYQ